MAITLAQPSPPVVARRGGAGRRLRDRPLGLAIRQLAVLVGAGVPVVTACALVADQSEERAVRHALADVARRIEHGSTCADAVAAQGDAFPPLAESLIRAGERGGVLESTLQRLAAHLEQTARLRRTVLGALAYPAVVVTAAVAVTGLLLGWVVPVFAEAFAAAGADLPGPTRFVLRSSETLQAHWAGGAGALGVGAAALAFGVRTPRGRWLRDRWMLRVPALGDLLAKAAVARAARTLGTMLACGVTVLDALDIAARTAGNLVVADAFTRARGHLAAGGSLAGSFAASDVVPAVARQMIDVGEATGALDVMLARVADCCDEDVQAAATTVLAVLEPALILFLGLLIGGLVVSMYLPIFRLGATLG